MGLQIFTEAQGQGVEVEVLINGAGRTAIVSGQFADGFTPINPRHVAFKRSVAGNDKLAERITDLELTGRGSVLTRRLLPGEYLAESDFQRWSYQIDLRPPPNRAAAAHSSWIGAEEGILMLDDLLPQFGSGVPGKVRIGLPEGWTAYGANGTSLDGVFSLNVEDAADSVIFVGRSLRSLSGPKQGVDHRIAIAGSWQFADDEAAAMTAEIFGEYSKMLGRLPAGRTFQIGIIKFPGQENPGHWEAETRGRTVTIVSSDMPFKTQSLQRLHEQLRHEIFHLWFPNGVNFTGDYAWFYEGFALYQSLKLGVRVNRIRFEDMLGTLSRAYTIDANAKPRLPLAGDPNLDPTVRYARGTLVAFLIDIEILSNSKGRSDVTEVLRNIFRIYGNKKESTDGAAAVSRALAQPRIVENYVFGSAQIEWTEGLKRAGLESTTEGRTTRLSVATKLNGRQKEILDRLGYNNWRKLGTKR